MTERYVSTDTAFKPILSESGAFNIEPERRVMDEELYDDVVSYLGEYRLNVQKYTYKLHFSGSSAHDMHLRDTYSGESMYKKVKRAIEEKEKRGLSTYREEAELRALGDPDNPRPESLESQLLIARDGDSVIWGSPPGSREEGYGDYGFMFVGKVNRLGPLDTRLTMTAIRIEQPTIFQYNAALSELTTKNIVFINAEAILAHPLVVTGTLDENTIDEILSKHFFFRAKKEDQETFQKVIRELSSTIKEFMQFVRIGTKEEKLQAFHALENYALALKKRYNRQEEQGNVVFLDSYRQNHLSDLMPYYGYKPPAVAGSCGSTGETASNNIFNKFNALYKALFGESEWFKCPKCDYQADGPVGNKCPSCGLTKEEYAKKSKKPVCA